MRPVEGEVVGLQCQRCRSRFFHVVFSGDTDMGTEGLGSLSSCDGRSVVVAEMTSEEWSAGNHGLDRFAVRIGKELGKTLHPVRLLSASNGARKLGVSFGSLLRRSPPASSAYSCPCCQPGEAHVFRRNVCWAVTVVGQLSFRST